MLSVDTYFSICPCCCHYRRCAKWVLLRIRSRRAIQANVIAVSGFNSVYQYLGISSRAATILGQPCPRVACSSGRLADKAVRAPSSSVPRAGTLLALDDVRSGSDGRDATFCDISGVAVGMEMSGSTERPEPNREAERSRRWVKGSDGVQRRCGSGR